METILHLPFTIYHLLHCNFLVQIQRSHYGLTWTIVIYGLSVHTFFMKLVTTTLIKNIGDPQKNKQLSTIIIIIHHSHVIWDDEAQLCDLQLCWRRSRHNKVNQLFARISL